MDRSEYSSADADYWYNKGKEDERAKIVAWLRDRKEMSDFYLDHSAAREIAMYIEAGEHLK